MNDKNFHEMMLSLKDVRLEELAVSCLIVSQRCFDEVSDLLTPEVFTNEKMRAVYQAINTMKTNGLSVDSMTLAQYMIENPQKGVSVTPADIAELSSLVASTVNCYQYAATLRDLWQRRQVLAKVVGLMDSAADRTQNIDEVLEQTADAIKAVADNTTTCIETAADATKELERMVSDMLGGRTTGTRTGFVCLDERGGLRPQALTVIAGYPGQGKSAIALQMAVNAAIEGEPTAFYTLEMSKAELVGRAVAADSGVKVSSILYNPNSMTQSEWKRYDMGVQRISSLPIYFDERAVTSVEAIIQSARTLVRKKHIKGIFVDYLQILVNNRKSGKGDEAFLGDTVRAFKNLAKSENIFVVLLSQLSRNHDSKEPTADYLRGSGQIFEGCDNCYLLFRPEVTGGTYSGVHSDIDPHGTAQVTVAKCRNRSVGGKYIIGFVPELTKFHELDGPPPKKGFMPERREEDPF